MKSVNTNLCNILVGGASLSFMHVAVGAALEEVIVTGLKRESTVMETPSAITTLSAEDLSARGLSNMNQIQYAVPSLHFGENYGNRNISIRGVGSFLEQPGVLTSINGVVQPSDASSQVSLLDLARVEVLRGPQGTLYGRNANGGVVNFIAAAPTDELFGYLKVGFAEYEQATAEIVVSGPITDRIGFRIAASHLDANEGWVENLQPGEDDLMLGEKSNARVIVTAELSDNFGAEIMLAHSEQSGRWTHWAMTDEHFDYGVMTGLPALDYSNDPAGVPILYTEEPHKVYMPGPVNTDRELDIYSLTLNWHSDNFSIKSITAQQEWKNAEDFAADSSSLGILQRSTMGENKSFSQEINISGTAGNLDWLVGGFYMDDERSDNFIIDFAVQALPFPLPFPYTPYVENQRPTYDNETIGVFADVTYSVLEDLRIGFGMRHTKEDKRSEHVGGFGVNSDAAGYIPFITNCAPDWPDLYVQEWEDSSNTVRASVEYDVGESGMTYVSYSEGFKSGGTNSGDCNPPWEPETIDATEIGYKAAFGNGQTTLRAAIFNYDYSDFQVLQVLNLAGVITNAGDAEIMGAELEINTAISDRWLINAAVTLLDSEYGSFLNSDGLRPGEPYQNEGNPLNNAPETSLILGGTYDVPLSSGGGVKLSLDASYRSRVYFREFGLKEDSQEAYTIVNFNANWESTERQWAARFYVTNLTDEEHITGMQGLQTTYGRQGFWAMPRQVGFELTRFFGSR